MYLRERHICKGVASLCVCVRVILVSFDQVHRLAFNITAARVCVQLSTDYSNFRRFVGIETGRESLHCTSSLI